MQINWEEQLESETDPKPRVPVWEKKKFLKTSDYKNLWGLKQQLEKFPDSQESSLERPIGS